MSNLNRLPHNTKLTEFSSSFSLKAANENEDKDRKLTKRQWLGQKFQSLVPWLIALSIVVAVVAALAVKCARDSQYPDYTHLNYTLKHAYEGETFFDNFNYFTG